MTRVLLARHLEAEAGQGHIFGPLDLTLDGGQTCVVYGEQGSGKSALLLALTGRLTNVSGHLEIAGTDAIAQPREAMKCAGVARIGDYIAPEDRLTVRESLYERCFLDGIPVAKGKERAEQLEQLAGYRLDRSMEIADLTPVERAVASVGLAMLHPTKVVVIDDVDMFVPNRQLELMFAIFSRMLTLDDAVLVAAVSDPSAAYYGDVQVGLPRLKPRGSHPVDESRALITTVEPTLTIDPDTAADAIRHAEELDDTVQLPKASDRAIEEATE